MERKSDRPKIKIQLESTDLLLEILGLVGLVFLIVLPIYYYSDLPETIPGHFGANGEPDKFREKDKIWTLPVIGTVLYAGLYWLNQYPHLFNYPQKVTAENAEQLYKITTRMIRTMNTVIVVVFAYIIYSTIQVAFGNQSGLGTWFGPTFLLLIFATSMISLFRLMK